MTIRTRFAPSPTGYLHIGGVRTALFNWLFARKHGGQFLLRIDDTDADRNNPAALQPILDGFKWLGMDWDEGPEVGGAFGPYYQSQKLEKYQAAVNTLLDKGLAYWDYATPDELKAERESAEKEKRPYIYSRRWMADTRELRTKFEAEGRKGVVRLMMPHEGVCRFHDHIRGDMAVEWVREQDHVIQRGDGSVLYNLANVVDDHDMKISHVIRAEEHLSNTPRQIFAAQGLGYTLPEYAHVPFVAEPGSKNKLSKRKIAQYLKNADFKKVYEHGQTTIARVATESALKLAIDIRKIVNDIAQTQVSTLPESQQQRILDEFNKRVPALRDQAIQTRMATQDTEFGKITSEILGNLVIEYSRNPAFLEEAEHGRNILEKLKSSLPPETFNPVIVDFFRYVGYLPDAILNYLVLLGWSLDDRTEFFTREEMIKSFSLERVIKSPASFDPKKLWSFQGTYMQRLPLEKKAAMALPYLQKAGLVAVPVSQEDQGKVTAIVQAAGERMITAGDILDYAHFFLADDQVPFDEKAFDKRIRQAPGARELLTKFKDQLAAVTAFDVASLETMTKQFIESQRTTFGDLHHALRVALTGQPVGFGLYETMAIFGRERCIDRIKRASSRE